MARFKNVNGTRIPLSPQEELEFDAQEAAWAAGADVRAAEEVRKDRNALLVASDWTQVADAPVDQGAWAVYRQELREITSQEGFPDNIIWPTQEVLP